MSDLKKLLYKLADAIAQEAEENPAFREKIEKALVSFAPTIQVQPPEKASDNPFELYRIDEGFPVFVVLTREPGEEIRFIHDRMPLILPEKCIDDWINPYVNPEKLIGEALTEMAFERVG